MYPDLEPLSMCMCMKELLNFSNQRNAEETNKLKTNNIVQNTLYIGMLQPYSRNNL